MKQKTISLDDAPLEIASALARRRGITIHAVIEHVVRQIAMGRKRPADDDIMRVGANDAGVGADGTALSDP